MCNSQISKNCLRRNLWKGIQIKWIVKSFKFCQVSREAKEIALPGLREQARETIIWNLGYFPCAPQLSELLVENPPWVWASLADLTFQELKNVLFVSWESRFCCTPFPEFPVSLVSRKPLFRNLECKLKPGQFQQWLDLKKHGFS